ncbi:MAG TPA: hypothetical protein VFQ00_04770 [Terriglobales bacterium]|nr:hypothetical protein [Terriglobales bacterium]
MDTQPNDPSAAIGPRSRPVSAILVGGFIVGILDLVYAIGVYSPKHPILIPQTIASGVLGAKAYSGGGATAVLGVVLHFFIAFVAAAIYYLVSRRVSFLIRRAFVSGLIYGAVVYLVMHWVVLPLSAVHPSHMAALLKLAEFVEHWFFVGLPIAMSVRHSSICPDSNCVLCVRGLCWPGKARAKAYAYR